jgi:hypothetical protein
MSPGRGDLGLNQYTGSDRASQGQGDRHNQEQAPRHLHWDEL